MTDGAGSGWSARELVLIALGLAAATFVGWAIGLEWAPALLVALGLAAVLGLRRVPVTNQDESWPPPPEAGSDQGVRREVTRLSWSLHGHESRVERPSLIRLRAVADRRLAQRGLHLGEPTDAAACQELLGLLGYRVLTADRGVRVGFDDFGRSLAAVEKLAEEDRR